MENDDRPISQILSRRDALKLLGLGSAAILVSCATPNATSTVIATANPTAGATLAALDCVVRPELTIGPYFVDNQLNHSDIRTEPSDNSIKPGVPLTLSISIASMGNNSCTPIQDAKIEVGASDINTGGPGGPGGYPPPYPPPSP